MPKLERLILILVLILSLLTAETKAQNNGRATGRVLDKDTGAPLANANVYLANTTFGASSNKAGRYLIENVPSGKYVIIVSMVGYKREHTTITIESGKTTKLNFEAIKQAVQLDEVTVDADDDWEEYYKIFEKELLGEFEFRDSCKILNPKDVSFKMDDDDVLHATCSKFITIENKALGYNLDILLNIFTWDTDISVGSYSVYPRFTEMTPDNDAQLNYWKENRRKAFWGSFRHFLQAVANDSVGLTNFSIYTGSSADLQFGHGISVKKKDMVINRKENYVEFCMENAYMVKNGYISHLTHFQKDKNLNCLLVPHACLLINYDGVLLNPEMVQVSGYWANQRLADALPYNYLPK